MKVALLLWLLLLWHGLGYFTYINVCYVVGYDRDEERIFVKGLLYTVGWLWPLTAVAVWILLVRKERREGY